MCKWWSWSLKGEGETGKQLAGDHQSPDNLWAPPLTFVDLRAAADNLFLRSYFVAIFDDWKGIGHQKILRTERNFRESFKKILLIARITDFFGSTGGVSQTKLTGAPTPWHRRMALLGDVMGRDHKSDKRQSWRKKLCCSISRPALEVLSTQDVSPSCSPGKTSTVDAYSRPNYATAIGFWFWLFFILLQYWAVQKLNHIQMYGRITWCFIVTGYLLAGVSSKWEIM